MENKIVVLIENKEAVPKEFNRIAKKYDFATGMSQGYQSDLNYSASLLTLKGNETVLDLCCGTGKSSKSILQYIHSGKVIGIDNSEGMLECARKKFQKECIDGKIEFHLQDAMHLNFEPNSFDAIFVAYGLRNMPDYESCMKQLYKLLKPGGKIVIHDYSLAHKWYSKLLWIILGWGFIVPFCTLVSGSSRIFTYLVRSVNNFLRPVQVKEMLGEIGYNDIKVFPHKGWRSAILHAFYAEKKF